jgi:hypothetical protein
MPICIAGMHRSGTSMVARLLNLCGVYLGADAELSAAALDNEAGFWENPRFVKLNEDALALLGGGWDLAPQTSEGWDSRDDLIKLKRDAEKLIDGFKAHALWGWKDPRNSIMLPLWRRLIPNLKTLVCLRNPLEVAQSLQKRGHSSQAFGLDLWLTYNQRVLSGTSPAERVVTHYNAYFYDPQAELRRVLKLLNISATDKVIWKACSTISSTLRHSWITTQELMVNRSPLEVLDCYMTMCAEAGAIYEASADKVKSLAEGTN